MGAVCSSAADCLRVETPGQVHGPPAAAAAPQKPFTDLSSAATQGKSGDGNGAAHANNNSRRPSTVNPHPNAPASYAAVVAGHGGANTLYPSLAASSSASASASTVVNVPPHPQPQQHPQQPYPLSILPSSWARFDNCVVVKVADGDTLTVRDCTKQSSAHHHHNNNDDDSNNTDPSLIRVRMAFVDAPESKQSYGPEAAAALVAKLGGKGSKVTVFVTDTDQYGRTVGLVLNSQGVDVNLMQVADGSAWLYPQYLNSKAVPGQVKTAYHAALAAAKQHKKGLWGHHASETADGSAMNPREWRKANPRGGSPF